MAGWKPGRRWVAGTLGLTLVLTAAPAAARAVTPKSKPKEAVLMPAAEIKLTAIGATMPAARMVEAGVSSLTVNLIDNTHLLVTFVTHALVPRLKDDPDTDQDRILAAEVVEIPSGHVLSKTTWQAHDEARYLWPVGNGWFVVRLGKELSLMNAGKDPNSPDALQRTSLAHVPGIPLGVAREPEGRAFSVITQEPLVKREGAQVSFGDQTDNAPKATYSIQYLRLQPDRVNLVAPTGQIRADVPLVMPMDADGYLWSMESEKVRGRWDVTFHPFGSEAKPAGSIDSSCVPRMHMVSRSEYVAFTCRGDDDSMKLRSMGLDGHETWEEDFSGFAQAPVFVTAVAASRFAMSHTWTSNAPGDISGTSGQTTTNQEVRVYQDASGDLLAKVALAPAFRTSENFDLSPDGRVLVTLTHDAIDVYSLPELSKADREDIAEVAKFAPPVTTATMSFPELFAAGSSKAAETATVAAKQVLSAPVSSTTAAPLTPVGGPETNSWGDTPPAGGRARPSLLNPGEKPEFKDKTAPVQ